METEGYQKLQGSPAALQESIPAAPLVAAAYLFIWFAVLVFVWSVWRRSRQTEQELTELQRKLAATLPQGGQPPKDR